MPRVSRGVLGLALAALAASTYANTLGHGFVWDDPISVQRWLPALPTWSSAFLPPPNIPQFPPQYYRPLQLLSYQLDRDIGGGAAWPFHLSVVLLHALATVLVYRTGAHLLATGSAGTAPALCAAALFAIHPIHSESVAWMAARPDVMVTCAGLAALLAYWHDGWTDLRRSAIAAALVLIGLLCKENAAALLLLVPASVFVTRSPARGPRDRRRAGAAVSTRGLSLAGLAPFAIAAALYVALRRAGVYQAKLGPVLPTEPLTLLAASGTYLRLLVLPYPQNAYIADVPTDAASWAGNGLALLAFAALAWRAWRRGDRPVLYSLAWIVVTLAPSLTLLAKSLTAPIAERYLYLPSVGFCWLVGAYVARASERGPRFGLVVQWAFAALVVAGFAMTLQRNQVWRDNYTLWTDTAAKSVIDGLPRRSLAAATLLRGDAVGAQRLFEQALTLRNSPNGQRLIYNNLGTIAVGRGDNAAAERYYRQSLALGATPDALYNLGFIALQEAKNPDTTMDGETRLAKSREARLLFEQAVAAGPYDPDAHVGLGYAAEALGDSAAARRHFEEALRLGLPAPTDAAVRRLIEEMK